MFCFYHSVAQSIFLILYAFLSFTKFFALLVCLLHSVAQSVFFDSPCVFEFHGVFALPVLFLLFLIVKNYVHYVPMCFKAIRTTLLHQFPVGLGFVWI